MVPVTAFEYHHASLDHYFVTDLAPDIEALDSGRIPGWARTGKSFKVWPITMGFLNDVCRYYIPPEHGNSHFFSASKAECDTIASRIGVDPNYSGYVLETLAGVRRRAARRGAPAPATGRRCTVSGTIARIPTTATPSTPP